MAKVNVNVPHQKNYPKTHEGAPAKRISAEIQLRRSVMACLLWENQFYEDGVGIAERIISLIPEVDTAIVSQLAIDARNEMNLRHVPLLIVREMARCERHKSDVARILPIVIQRADELAEFVALYFLDGKQPLSAQVKKGLAKAFEKFDKYQISKYDRKGIVRLRDVMFLSHPKPKDKEQEAVWKKLANGTLEPPDTWEVALSSGEDKKEAWTRLLIENKMGAMAVLRNLRNFQRDNVDENLIINAIDDMNVSRILPFRFIAAAKYAPHLEPSIEDAMIRGLKDHKKLSGKTKLLVDASGSMDMALSAKSDMRRFDAACGLAILLREICEDIQIFRFNGPVFKVPPRHGFALRDAMGTPYNGTSLGNAVQEMNDSNYDRLIVITDEQSRDEVPGPKGKGYMVNVASYKNGVGYGKWIHIDGWSEAIVRYIQELESEIDTPIDKLS